MVSERVPKLLDFMQLGDTGDAKVMQLSGGLKRRLVIARALIAEPGSWSSTSRRPASTRRRAC